jgi:hypothetical protein
MPKSGNAASPDSAFRHRVSEENEKSGEEIQRERANRGPENAAL